MFLTPLLLAAVVTTAPASAKASVGIESLVLAMPTGPATGLGVQVKGPIASYAGGEVRALWDGNWTGRAGAGLDVFGNGDRLDLTFGLFLGGYGDLDGRVGLPMAGGEVGVGVGVGALKLRYRHVHGAAEIEEDCTWSQRLRPFAENELRLSYRFGEKLTVFGQVTDLAPRVVSDDRENAYGLGARYTF